MPLYPTPQLYFVPNSLTADIWVPLLRGVLINVFTDPQCFIAMVYHRVVVAGSFVVWIPRSFSVGSQRVAWQTWSRARKSVNVTSGISGRIALNRTEILCHRESLQISHRETLTMSFVPRRVFPRTSSTFKLQGPPPEGTQTSSAVIRK